MFRFLYLFLSYVYFNVFHFLNRPEKDTEIFFDGTTPTFRCVFKGSENGKSNCLMQYQKEDIFFAYFIGSITQHTTNRHYIISKLKNTFEMNTNLFAYYVI
jgi:hypothetical protein